jgi:predicted SnoaL-like aldol condensation-catalyzing enzyme
MGTTTDRDYNLAAPHLRGLLRHFADLRDGTHGNGATSRSDKEQLFVASVAHLDPYARQALAELNDTLLLGSGTISASGVTRTPGGDMTAFWRLAWPEQEQAGIPPITLEAFFGQTFHHPHLRGGTVGVWPLNVFSAEDAASELATLRAIAGADLHNLVFRSDYRIVPAITAPVPQTPKDIAIAFMRLVVAGAIREAYERCVAQEFTSHNPFFGASAGELVAAMEENHRTHPHQLLEVQHVIAEGDLVVVHSRIRLQPDDRGLAAVHIFRFAGNRIVELWDVGQPVPDSTVNGAGMF